MVHLGDAKGNGLFDAALAALNSGSSLCTKMRLKFGFLTILPREAASAAVHKVTLFSLER